MVNKMAKSKPTKSNIFFIEPYKTILNLIIYFQNHKHGLTFEHLKKILLKEYNINSFKIYFGNKIHIVYDLIKSNKIKPNQITSSTNLSNFLYNLLELKVIKKEKIGKKYIYKINKKYLKEGIRLENKYLLESCDLEDILFFNKSIKNTQLISRHVFYGFSKKLYNFLLPDTKKEIEEHLKIIEEHLTKIDNIKSDILWVIEKHLFIKKIKMHYATKKRLNAFINNNGLDLLQSTAFMFRNIKKVEGLEEKANIKNTNNKLLEDNYFKFCC